MPSLWHFLTRGERYRVGLALLVIAVCASHFLTGWPD